MRRLCVRIFIMKPKDNWMFVTHVDTWRLVFMNNFVLKKCVPLNDRYFTIDLKTFVK